MGAFQNLVSYTLSPKTLFAAAERGCGGGSV